MTEYRINTSTRALMIALAIIFDVLQLATKIFIFIGLTSMAALYGAYLGGKIGAPEYGAYVGAALGGLLTISGIGTVFAFQVGATISMALGWAVVFVGYLTLYLWLWNKGVTLFSGDVGQKITWTVALTLAKLIPIVDLVPAITLWTFRMIYLSRAEDEEKAKQKKEDEEKNYMRVRRMPANDNTPQVANDNIPEQVAQPQYAR